MMVGALLGIAGLIYSVLGLLHAVYTLLDKSATRAASRPTIQARWSLPCGPRRPPEPRRHRRVAGLDQLDPRTASPP